MQRRRAGERGIMLIWVALTLAVLIGIVGLAMDGGQMYVTKQKAQAAADAAALAGAMDMYNGTYPTGGYGSKTTCSTTSGWTPCYYARQNGFGSGAGDSVVVDFSPSGTCAVPSGLGNLASDSPNVICVTVSRVMNTLFMRVLGTNTSTVSAVAKAALALSPATVPIVVTHPHLVDALSASGNSTLKICGGPSRGVQVNSDGTLKANGQLAAPPEAFSIGSNSPVDLSQAGPGTTLATSTEPCYNPADPSQSYVGSGADFRSWAAGASADTVASINSSPYSGGCPAWLCIGPSGHFIEPGSAITDPFLSLPQPSQPGPTASQIDTSSPSGPAKIAQGASLGAYGCSKSCPAVGGCYLYQPGTYTGGIQVTGNSNVVAYFYPGLYYIIDDKTNKSNVGFVSGPNSDMEMLSSVCPVANDAGTGAGMVVFNSGSGTFSVGSNGSANLIGPAVSNTTYEGILFWENRNITSSKSAIVHSFGGGGDLTLQGTIYANMLIGNVNNKVYQAVTLSGNSGSTTAITGEIVTNVLQLGGGGTIKMTLSSAQLQNVRQVALVQ